MATILDDMRCSEAVLGDAAGAPIGMEPGEVRFHSGAAPPCCHATLTTRG